MIQASEEPLQEGRTDREAALPRGTGGQEEEGRTKGGLEEEEGRTGGEKEDWRTDGQEDRRRGAQEGDRSFPQHPQL